MKKNEGRVLSILTAAISSYLLETANRKPFISILYIQMNKSGHTANVYVSVLPETEVELALKFLKRKERECLLYVRKNTSIQTVSAIRFVVPKNINIQNT